MGFCGRFVSGVEQLSLRGGARPSRHGEESSAPLRGHRRQGPNDDGGPRFAGSAVSFTEQYFGCDHGFAAAGLREFRPTLRCLRNAEAPGSLAVPPGAVTVTLFTSIKLPLTLRRKNPQKVRGRRAQGAGIVAAGDGVRWIAECNPETGATRCADRGRNDIGGPRCRETRRGGRSSPRWGSRRAPGAWPTLRLVRAGVPSLGHHPRSGDVYARYNCEFRVNGAPPTSSESASEDSSSI